MEYRDRVLATYQQLVGAEYEFNCEGMRGIDIAKNVQRPFPFVTQNPMLIGEFMMAYGHIIKIIGEYVKTGRPRVLEIGSGRGALSYFLAKAGFELTCVDVNPEFVQLCETITASVGNKARCYQSTMEDFTAEQEFDVVLFFESFHHSLSHQDLIPKYMKMLSDSGVLMFAAEPIVKPFSKSLPYDWGLRLGGEALRGIVIHGWMELGFSRSYFKKLLKNNDLCLIERNLPRTGWGDIKLGVNYNNLGRLQKIMHRVSGGIHQIRYR